MENPRNRVQGKSCPETPRKSLDKKISYTCRLREFVSSVLLELWFGVIRWRYGRGTTKRRYTRRFDVHSGTCACTVTFHKDRCTIQFGRIFISFHCTACSDVFLNIILSKWTEFITSQTNRVIRVAIFRYRGSTLINNPVPLKIIELQFVLMLRLPWLVCQKWEGTIPTWTFNLTSHTIEATRHLSTQETPFRGNRAISYSIKSTALNVPPVGGSWLLYCVRAGCPSFGTRGVPQKQLVWVTTSSGVSRRAHSLRVIVRCLRDVAECGRFPGDVSR